jgi:hypothetical protein
MQQPRGGRDRMSCDESTHRAALLLESGAGSRTSVPNLHHPLLLVNTHNGFEEGPWALAHTPAFKGGLAPPVDDRWSREAPPLCG